MKIFQLIQKPQLRGAEIFACQLAQELTIKGHECVVITLFEGESRLPFDGRVIHLGLAKGKRFLDWKGWKKLSVLMEQEKPDLLQANAGDTLKYAVISKLIFGWNVPVIFRNASTVSLYIKNPLVKRWNAFLYSRVAHIISVCQFTCDDFVRMFPSVANRISVVPVGIEDRKILSVESDKKGSNVLLHVGGFTFEKNHKGLIRILEAIVRHNKKVMLWLVGDGPLRFETEAFVKARGLEDYVKFWGYQANPGEFFQQANVFLLPSIIEGLPAVILESFYYKIPVVAYDVGGVGEIVRKNETGFLVDKGNENAFAKATLEALKGGFALTDYIENAYARVVKNYTLKSVAGSFEIIYASLLKTKG